MNRLVFLLLWGCADTPPPTSPSNPPPVETPAEVVDVPPPVDAVPRPETGLCPADLTALSNWLPPSPYVPTQPICVQFMERKMGECAQAIVDAIADVPVQTVNPADGMAMSPLHLDAQCECVPERRAAVDGCTGAADCETFARCAINLIGDGWQPQGTAP